MLEWDATCLGRREPLLVVVTWTDAAYDNTFSCPLSEVRKRATLQTERKSDGRLVYVNAETDVRLARVVLANCYDAAEGSDEAHVENFMIVPLKWVRSIKLAHGRIIYEQEVTHAPTMGRIRARRTVTSRSARSDQADG